MMKVVAPDTGVLTVDIDAVGPYGANAVDSYVEVYDANLNLIGANDDFNGSTDSFLQVNVTYGGTYYVAVTTFGNRSFDPANPFNRQSTTGETGFYDLYTSFSNGDQNGTAFSAASRPVGQVVSGVIGSDFGQPLLGANGGFKDVDFFIYTATSDGLFDATAGSPDNSMSPSLVMWKFTPGADTITKIADTGSKGAHVIKNMPRYFSIIEPILKANGIPEDFRSPAWACTKPSGAVKPPFNRRPTAGHLWSGRARRSPA